MTVQIHQLANGFRVVTERLAGLQSATVGIWVNVGESGTIGAPSAVIGAILDALAPLGVSDIAMPATPESIWRAIQDAR